jgi:hypothetical protein
MAQCDPELCKIYRKCFDVYGTGEDKPPCAEIVESLKTSHNNASAKLPPCEWCRDDLTLKFYLDKEWCYCPHCGRQLRT